MCREQIVSLIDEKRKLYDELHKIHLERDSIDSEFLFKSYDVQQELQKKIDNNEKLEQEKNAQIKRSHIFGHKYTKGDKPIYCMSCFVYKNIESPLEEKDSSLGNGIKSFSCKKCTTCLDVELIVV